MLLLAVSSLSGNMHYGFGAAMIASAISSWYRPCNTPYLFGAALSLVCIGLVSFILIDGSAALEMFPLLVMVAATALLCGVVSAKFLRYVCGRV